MLLLTLRGTPTLYQGDELGMEDAAIPPHRVRDPWEINVPGLGLGRDPVRTPMLWSGAPYAGFSTVEPWLPLGDSWREIHVERQAKCQDSMLSLYRALLNLRRQEPALWRGDYIPVAATENLLAYERRAEAERLLVILDLSGHGGSLTTPSGTIILATGGNRSGRQVGGAGGAVTIPANEGLIIRLIG